VYESEVYIIIQNNYSKKKMEIKEKRAAATEAAVLAGL
jgi:hypothetical protein